MSVGTAVPEILQELLRVLGSAPLKEAGESGGLPLTAATVLRRILRCRRYGRQLHALFPGLFLELVFQMLGNAEDEDVDEVSPPIGMVLDLALDLLLFADLHELVEEMDACGIWKQLLCRDTWRSSIYSLARVMVQKCRHRRARIFAHLQKLLLHHELQWREVSAITLYVELRRYEELRVEDTCAEQIFRKYIRSEQLKSWEQAVYGLRSLYSGRQQLLLPDALQWLQDARPNMKVEAMRVLRYLVLEYPDSTRSVCGQLATQLLSCFNEDDMNVRWSSMRLFKLLLLQLGNRQLLPQAERSLLLLCIHLNEDLPKMAQTARDTLSQAAKLLGWKELQRLAKKADSIKIANCVLQKADSALEPYLEQCVQHLHSPQVQMREAAVRFLGLLAQRLHSENPERMPDIRRALQSAQEDSEPAVRCLVQQTLLILRKLKGTAPTRPGALHCWLQRMCGN
ncbi:uncharacterized protein LOC110406611 [Numida meleagris]|uniref:uncharacterized protein LOC110406611 n=1 Tax=Numida meleagris TaxID=8996 RepID=UPI000B3DF93E|nr:uncharacterized protein LOC110406611 [Numida meleagris]